MDAVDSADDDGMFSPDAVAAALDALEALDGAASEGLAGVVAALRPRHLVALGLGPQIRHIAQASADAPGPCALTIVTHDAAAAEAVLRYVPRAPRWPRSLAIAPIVETATQPAHATYRRQAIRPAVPEPPDVIVIDGPSPALGGRVGAVGLATMLARRGTVLLAPRATASDGPALLAALRAASAGCVEGPRALGSRRDIVAFVVATPAADPEGADPAMLLPAALARTPRTRPTLALIGARAHYERSELRLLEGIDFDLVHLQTPADVARLPGDRPVGYLRWAPDRRLPIAADLRAALPPGVRILNDTHFDGAKSNVEEVFARVAGYPLRVDPRVHRGPALRKSEAQATHDGTIVDLPIDHPQPGFVYQRLVASEIGERNGVLHHLDIRVPVIDGWIPYVSVKIVPAPRRFGVRTGRAAILQQMFAPGDLFGDDEIRLLLAFCRQIGMDFGALDVMRDAVDGRIYIVDANDTPSPADGNLGPREVELRRRLFARALRERVFGLPG